MFFKIINLYILYKHYKQIILTCSMCVGCQKYSVGSINDYMYGLEGKMTFSKNIENYFSYTQVNMKALYFICHFSPFSFLIKKFGEDINYLWSLNKNQSTSRITYRAQRHCIHEVNVMPLMGGFECLISCLQVSHRKISTKCSRRT